MNDSSTGGYIQPVASGQLVEDAALDAVLQGLVSGITGMPGNMVRPRWQLVPPPQPDQNTDWCAIGVTSEDPYPSLGDETHFSADTSGNNPKGLSVTNEWAELHILASFYGPNARGNATLFRSGICVAQNREALYGTGLGLKERPDRIVNVSYEENQQTVRRYDMEFCLNRTVTRIWPIDDLLSAAGDVVTAEMGSQPFLTPNIPDP